MFIAVRVHVNPLAVFVGPNFAHFMPGLTRAGVIVEDESRLITETEGALHIDNRVLDAEPPLSREALVSIPGRVSS